MGRGGEGENFYPSPPLPTFPSVKRFYALGFNSSEEKRLVLRNSTERTQAILDLFQNPGFRHRDFPCLPPLPLFPSPLLPPLHPSILEISEN